MAARRPLVSLVLARCALSALALSAGSIRMSADVPVALRPLQRQEIVDKLDGVPVFSVVNRQTQQVVPTAAENGVLCCYFHVDVDEAAASLAMLQARNPTLELGLTATPLGTAYALCEWERQASQEDEEEDSEALGLADGDDYEDDPDAPKIELRLQAARAEVEVATPLLAEAPVPPLLRRRNQVSGALPLFGSDQIRFAADEGAGAGSTTLPLFFKRDDLRAAWLASGGKADAMPPVQVTDLRTLAWQMQYDISQDWRPLLFVAPASSIDFVVAEGGGEPAGPPIEAVEAPEEAEAADAPTSKFDLSRADVAGLVFGPSEGPL